MRSGDAGGSGVPGGTVTGFLVGREVMVDMCVDEICSNSAESQFSSEYTVRVEGPRWAACGRGGQRRPGSLEARADWAARRAWSGEPRGAEEELGTGHRTMRVDRLFIFARLLRVGAGVYIRVSGHGNS